MRDDAMTAAAAKITNIVWEATSNPISNPPISGPRIDPKRPIPNAQPIPVARLAAG